MRLEGANRLAVAVGRRSAAGHDLLRRRHIEGTAHAERDVPRASNTPTSIRDRSHLLRQRRRARVRLRRRAARRPSNKFSLSLSGADQIVLGSPGELSMRAGGTAVRLKQPVVYQERNGTRTRSRRLRALGQGRASVRSSLGRYDPSLPLVIDPIWVFGSTSRGLARGSRGGLGWAAPCAEHDVRSDRHSLHAGEPGIRGTADLRALEARCRTRRPTATSSSSRTCRAATRSRSRRTTSAISRVCTWATRGATTVASVNESAGAPVVNYFTVGNYDSMPFGEGIQALAVNGARAVFLLGACRIVVSGEPPLDSPATTKRRSGARRLRRSVHAAGPGPHRRPAADSDEGRFDGKLLLRRRSSRPGEIETRPCRSRDVRPCRRQQRSGLHRRHQARRG